MVKSDSRSKCTTLENAIAGGFAGLVADALLHPFDTINTRLKVHNGTSMPFFKGTRNIIAKEGFSALYAGIGVTLFASMPATGIYFAVYESVKNYTSDTFPSIPKPLIHALSGVASELSVSVVTVPCEVVKCRLQLGKNPNKVSGGWVSFTQQKYTLPSSETVRATKNYSSTLNAFRSIIRVEGYRGLFSGYTSCLVTDCVFSAFQFIIYEKIKLLLQNSKSRSTMEALDIVDTLIIGALSGGIAAIISNPFDVVTTRLMVQGEKMCGEKENTKKYSITKSCTFKKTNSPVKNLITHYTGILDCFGKIIRSEGYTSLFKGVVPRLLHIAPMASITFTVYEQFRSFLKKIPLQHNMPYEELNANSKSCDTQNIENNAVVLRKRKSKWGDL